MGRKAEIEALFNSLLRQNRTDYELIVVDQNQDDRLVDIVTRYQEHFPLRHVRIDGSGASRARNVGLAYAVGELVGFPDDDCRYLDGYLDAVDRIFFLDPVLCGLTGLPTTEEKSHNLESRDGSQGLTTYTVHNRCQEFTIFLRRERVGEFRFNERMGVGASGLWGADEGPDLLIRLMRTGCKIRYFPGTLVFHPNKIRDITPQTLRRAASYARGRGCLMRLHRFPMRIIFRSLSRAIAAFGFYLLTMRPLRSTYYITIFVGTLRGLLMSRSELAYVGDGASLPTTRLRVGTH